ncbi:multiheme c-type cytochrome [Tunturiibacter empetritectus]|uniref:Cytochrome c-552/4 domain-containing protein n=2 Tax=Tunturiibacter TaxID=3154218 RepID=A0A852VD01_9BACT|nr:hypothetical protein [Edaphobacter lichenicola]
MRASERAVDQTASSALHTPLALSAYAGDAACLACHQQISESYVHTAHHLTSQVASAESIHGSFSAGANALKTANPGLTFEMQAMPDGSFTQTANYVTRTGTLQTLTQPIDLVTGSGRKGQTYLYWAGELLFELPVSYWTVGKEWINSPGYQDGTAHFDRPIAPQCLECHASYFESLAPPVNRFDRTKLVLGIGCERCHGPGAEHVRRERLSPQPRPGSSEEAIVNPARLDRERQIDVCALCHAGAGEALAQPLSFKPGDVLAEYVRSPAVLPGAPLDVHTNQVQLLRESKCFLSSNMTCSTCHDTHEEQRDVAALSSKCLGCHTQKACPKYKTLPAAIKTRCVECHMPLQHSNTLFSDNSGERLTPKVRNHRIAVYAEFTAK